MGQVEMLYTNKSISIRLSLCLSMTYGCRRIPGVSSSPRTLPGGDRLSGWFLDRLLVAGDVFSLVESSGFELHKSRNLQDDAFKIFAPYVYVGSKCNTSSPEQKPNGSGGRRLTRQRPKSRQPSIPTLQMQLAIANGLYRYGGKEWTPNSNDS